MCKDSKNTINWCFSVQLGAPCVATHSSGQPCVSRSCSLLRTGAVVPRPGPHLHHVPLVLKPVIVVLIGGLVARQAHLLLGCRHVVRGAGEERAQIQLRNVVKDRQREHHECDAREEVDGGEHLVQRSVGLVRRVPGDVVAQTDRCQRHEAVVERVQVVPVGLQVREDGGRHQQE